MVPPLASPVSEPEALLVAFPLCHPLNGAAHVGPIPAAPCSKPSRCYLYSLKQAICRRAKTPRPPLGRYPHATSAARLPGGEDPIATQHRSAQILRQSMPLIG